MIHPQFAAETAAAHFAAYPADPERDRILAALESFARQRPGLEYGNYGDPVSYRAESRAITRDLHHVYTLLRRVQLAPSITSADLKEAFRAFSGRLSWDGSKLDYSPGQYFATEYRRAVCAVLASALWAYWRDNAPEGLDHPGDYLRAKARREFGRTIAGRWFD